MSDAIIGKQFDDIQVSLAMRGQLKKPLPPRLWELLRQRLQSMYRTATGEPDATLIVKEGGDERQQEATETGIPASDKERKMQAALEQAKAWLERQIACATGGTDISDVDYAQNFNAVMMQIDEALAGGDHERA